jgi:hypothetical protein
MSTFKDSSRALTAVLIGLFPLVGLSAQDDIPMPTDKGNITLLYDGIITNGTFSTLQGRIRNDTPNELTSLVFEVVAYDQNGVDLRICDPFNAGSRCEFQISTPLQTGQAVRIEPGIFYPSRPIPRKRHISRIDFRVVTVQFVPLPIVTRDPQPFFTPNDGDVVVWDITFIPDTHPMLSFRLANHTPFLGSDSTPGLGSTIRIRLNVDGLCEGKPTQWISDDWLRPHNFKYYKATFIQRTVGSGVDCEVRSFKGQLTLDANAALSNSYQFSLPLRVDVIGEPNGPNVLVFHVKDRIPQIVAQQAADKLAADTAKAEQDAKDAAEAARRAQEEQRAAEAQAKKDAAEAARRKRLAAEQKRKQAELDARIAKERADEEAKAAEERRKIRLACSTIYQSTADKKLKDLTVKEEQQVRACQALGLYPPQ